jgi:hypothetical protein
VGLSLCWPTAAWRVLSWIQFLLPFVLPLPTSLTRPKNMSAVRRGDRRAARNQQSSPYSRPNAQPKKSVGPHVLRPSYFARSRLTSALVLVIIGLLQLFKPLASQEIIRGTGGGISDEGASDDEKQTADGLEFEASRPPEILSQRGHAVRHTYLHIILLKSNVPIHLSQIGSRAAATSLPVYTCAPASECCVGLDDFRSRLRVSRSISLQGVHHI